MASRNTMALVEFVIDEESIEAGTVEDDTQQLTGCIGSFSVTPEYPQKWFEKNPKKKPPVAIKTTTQPIKNQASASSTALESGTAKAEQALGTWHGGTFEMASANLLTFSLQVSNDVSLFARKNDGPFLFMPPCQSACLDFCSACVDVIPLLLSRSGDVESNPGPNTKHNRTEQGSSLSPDFRTVLQNLHDN